MIGSLKEKRNIRVSKERRAKEHLDDIRKRDEFIRTLNNVAIANDIDKRFSEYNTDPSVGNMYQRKIKRKKIKSKRKRCDCKV
jgi:hypothetical protein